MIASLTNSHSTVYCFISNTQLCTSVLLYYCTAVCMQITHLLRIYTSASVKAVRKNKIPVSEHTAVFNQIYQGRGEGGDWGTFGFHCSAQSQPTTVRQGSAAYVQASVYLCYCVHVCMSVSKCLLLFLLSSKLVTFSTNIYRYFKLTKGF